MGSVSEIFAELLSNEQALYSILLVFPSTIVIHSAIKYFYWKKKQKKRNEEFTQYYKEILYEGLSDYAQKNSGSNPIYRVTIRDNNLEEHTRLYNRDFNFYYDELLSVVSKLNRSQKKMQEEFEKMSLLLSSTGVYNNASTNQQGIDAVVMLKQISEMANIDNLLDLMQDQTENKLVITNNVISEIAHTIRTPITGIQAILLMAEKKWSQDEAMNEYIHDIRTYLDQINQNLNAYRNLMTETLDEQISGNQSFVERLTSRLRGSIISCNKRLYIDSAGVDPIEMDNDICNLLLLALDCIVENATVFADDNSTIRVLGKSDEACYTFFVENDGPQINKDIANKVFEHGFSTHSSSGKGLFLVKRVIQDRLGGDVDFENIESPNEGVRFVIVLDKEKLTKKERTNNGQDTNSGE